MRIVPVLDIKNRQVVRGIGGRRREYRPIVSRLTPSSQPGDVALAFRDHFGLTELYLADLDAIAGSAPAWPIYAEIGAFGCDLWVDAGVREAGLATQLAEVGIKRVVVGLETIAGPRALATICRDLGSQRVAFSLDLKNGNPLGDPSAWSSEDAWSIAAEAITVGVRLMIVLDLAKVGLGGGVGTERLCQRLVETYPQVEVAAGGGVGDMSDLRRLKNAGVRAVLVASALHDGRLGPGDLADL